MLGVAVDDLADGPLWVDTGTEQLIVPLASKEAVRRATPSAEVMLAHAGNGERAMAYVFARKGDDVLARFFFLKHGAVVEDPGTGSACANLGGWRGHEARGRIRVGQADGRKPHQYAG